MTLFSYESLRYELCHDTFKQFLEPSNLTAQLLLSYFVGIQLLMVPLAAYEWPGRADSSKTRVLNGTIEWATQIFDRLEDTSLAHLTGWPKKIADIVLRELDGESVVEDDGTIVGVLRLDLPPAVLNLQEGSVSDSASVDLESFWEDCAERMVTEQMIT